MSSVNFKSIVEAAGVPTTEAGLISKFRTIAVEEGVVLNNTCEISPFWRLTSILVARPLKWLVDLLHMEIFPALFLKTATGEWVDLFAWQLGLERKAATKARGEIVLTRSDNSTLLNVPTGTVIQSAAINGITYRLTTIDAYSFGIGESECSVIAEALEAGSAYNLSTGFYNVLSTSLAGVVSVSNEDDWLLIPGTDEETDDDLKDRCRNQFTAINQWHIDQAYIAMMTQWPGVSVSDIYLQSNAPRGPGTANAYILFDYGAPASEYIEQIQAYITDDGNHGFSDDLLIAAMPTQLIDQSATLVLSDILDTAAKEIERAAIESVIRIALRDMPLNDDYAVTRTLPNSRFVWSKLVSELHQLFPDTLISIDFSDDDDIITDLWVPELDTLVVTLES